MGLQRNGNYSIDQLVEEGCAFTGQEKGLCHCRGGKEEQAICGEGDS